MNRSISVVIPVKNDERKIENCLRSVLNQTVHPIEVIVVDGHSTDDTINQAKKFPVKIVIEDYGTIGGARQRGVENATGEYIAFTDSDCIPEKNWLENLSKEFNGDIVGVGGGIKNIGRGIWEESIGFALDTFLGSANSVQDRVLKNKQFVRSISGCNSIYRKRDLQKVGGFDVTSSINEDTEINKRLLKIGRILYTPEAIVLHNQERNIGQFCKRMFLFGFGRGFNRLVDLQIIPPLLLIVVIAMLFIKPDIFFALIIVYGIIISIFSIDITVRKTKKLTYLITVPIIFLLEHSFYSMGFWWGIVRRGVGVKK
jgi:glycosyltransferase involved in cell wall biosynthesis